MHTVRLLTAVALTWLASAPAGAATALETARRASATARANVEGLRQRQTALRQQLNATGDRIAALKASGRRVIGNAALDAELRRSQELSSTLGGLATEIAAAEAEAEARDVALVEALAAELESLRREVERTPDRAVRAQLYARMRTLRTERDQRRGALPPSRVPSLPETRGDDPEDLLEQADALRDAEDKVRARLVVLEARIGEARAERELDRRMREFAEDEAIFDEQDRRLDRTPTSARGEAASDFDTSSGPVALPNSDRGNTVAGTPSPNMLGDDAAPAAPGPLEGLGALEAERTRLKAIADELARRAKAAEDRARSLD